MERPSRALRRLPGRPSSPIKSTSPKKSLSPTKKAASPGRKAASPSRKLLKEKKSPSRRSRSRSAGRKKLATKDIEEKKLSPPKNLNSKNKSTSPTKNVVSRVKDSVEKFTKSLSPEVEKFVRQSISRFEEVTSDVVRRSVTPRTAAPAFAVTTRSKLRSNNLASTQEVEDEKGVKNHVGKPGLVEHSNYSSEISYTHLFKSGLTGLLVLLLAGTSLLSYRLCTRDDCRLVAPTLEKLLNYRVFWDQYTWPLFTASLIAFFASHRFLHLKIKKAPYVSVHGIGWLLISLISLAVCHFYFGGLKNLRILPLISASVFHTLILAALSANTQSIFSVRISSLVYRLSHLLAIVVSAWISAAETSRANPNIGVFALCGLQAWQAADSLLFEPMLNWTSPLSLLLLVLRPLSLLLVPIFISANNVKLHPGLIAGVVTFAVVGYIIYRHSLFTKARYLSESYSHRHSKLSEYSEGAWKVLRQPHLTGRLLSDLGLCLSLAASPPLAGCLALLALLSTLAESANDSSLLSSYRAPDRKLLVPYIY